MTAARRARRDRILITGASAGLGEGMAREFAARGRDLALCARRLDRLTELRADLRARHPAIRVAVAELDVTEAEAVPKVFGALREELGGLDRIVVNAAFGKGRPVGTGEAAANRAVAETTFEAAVTQCEAAMEIFRAAGRGHLVLVSSMSALRGFPGNLTVYAASKAGVSALAEGLCAETMGTDIRVTALLPGYIRSESNPHAGRVRLVTDTEPGCRLMVRAIERERKRSCVPGWPWTALGMGMRVLPLRVTSRFGVAAQRSREP